MTAFYHYNDNWKNLKVQTEYKLKYHGDELDKDIFRATTRKHNELVEQMQVIIRRLENRIEELEKVSA